MKSAAWPTWRLRAGVLLAAALSGCGGGASALFFGGDAPEISRKPPNSTEYRCDGGAVLYLRRQGNDSVWLIAPDREIRLDKKPSGRYAFGRVELDIDGDRIDLIDPPVNQVNCKRTDAAPKR